MHIEAVRLIHWFDTDNALQGLKQYWRVIEQKQMML